MKLNGSRISSINPFQPCSSIKIGLGKTASWETRRNTRPVGGWATPLKKCEDVRQLGWWTSMNIHEHPNISGKNLNWSSKPSSILKMFMAFSMKRSSDQGLPNNDDGNPHSHFWSLLATKNTHYSPSLTIINHHYSPSSTLNPWKSQNIPGKKKIVPNHQPAASCSLKSTRPTRPEVRLLRCRLVGGLSPPGLHLQLGSLELGASEDAREMTSARWCPSLLAKFDYKYYI